MPRVGSSRMNSFGAPSPATASEEHFLLVAAAQVLDELLRTRASCIAQRRDELGRPARFAPCAPDLRPRSRGWLAGPGRCSRAPLRFGMMPSTLRSSAVNAIRCLQGVARVELNRDRLAADGHRAAVGTVHPEKQARCLGASAAQQPRQTHDFAGPHADRSIGCDATPCARSPRSLPASGCTRGGRFRLRRARWFMVLHLGHVLADHPRDEMQPGQLCRGVLADVLAIPQDTVMRSVTAYTCSRKCVTNTMPNPSALAACA